MKLLVIGLDGATFRILDPLCEEGKLPNIAKLVEKGARGLLESTFPPHTTPAWTTMATGKNPGKTGVFDTFLRTSKDSYDTTLVSSSYLKKAGTYWDYLSNAGNTISVVNYPFLFPPYPINGSMVSGFGSNHRAEITFPVELKDSLLKICGEYYTSLPQKALRYADNPQLIVDDCLKLVEQNKRSIQFFLDKEEDILVFVVSVSDFAQHFMWKYLDNTHPYFNAQESQKYLPQFINIWQNIDEVVGLAAEKLENEANIMLVSDHGFGPDRSTFYTDTWLKKNGYLLTKKGASGTSGIINPAVKLLKKWKSLYSAMAPLHRGRRFSKRYISTDIDRSIAFSPTNASAMVGKICINEKALTRNGEQSNVELLRREIMDNLRNTCTNLGLHVDIYTREELYSGPYTNLAPDIIFSINDFECSIRESYSKDIFLDRPHVSIRSGSHKRHGILIASGSDFTSGISIENPKIADVAPTILHLLGLPVPTDMDGKVLTELFRPDSEPAQRKIQYEATNAERERITNKIYRLKTSGKL